MKILKVATTVTAIAAAATAVAAGGTRSGVVVPPDVQWLRSSAQQNVYEISLGNLAVAKGSGAACAIGRMLVVDHVRSLADTRRVAKVLGVELPTRPSIAQRSALDRLRSAHGVAFQRLFIRVGLADHRTAL